jgi:uncharacterized protein (DUF362 family)
MVKEAVTNLEVAGIKIPTKGTVFIKPNLLISATAKDSITTEPRFVSALVSLLRERGVKKVYVGDSSAGFAESKEALDVTGMGREVKAAGAEIINIDDPAERRIVPMPGSDIVSEISLPSKMLDADSVINFAKLKTHRFGAMTGSVKNWVGLIEQKTRLKYHQGQLPKLVSEIHKILSEQLCFTDAVVVGEGDGPDLSAPRFLGVLVASNDPVANDSISSELLSINKNELIFPWTAYLDGTGEILRNNIVVIGPETQDLAIKVERPVEVLHNRFPCNMIIGGMCPGCFVWFIGPALFWEKDGLWEKMVEKSGRPTFMIGFNAEDIHFERHLAEGPYFVIGDCAPEKYRTHPKVIHIPGCTPGPGIPDLIMKHYGEKLALWGDK